MADRDDPLARSEDDDWKLVHHILDEHGGTLEVAPSSQGGLHIRIWLPASEQQTPLQDRPLQPAAEQPEDTGLSQAPADEQPPRPAPPQKLIDLTSTERRRTPRIAVQLDARLTQNGATWVGTVSNFSLGGLHMVFEGIVPAAVNQPIQIGLTSAAGVLQVGGRVCRVQEVDRRRVGLKIFPAVSLAVEFATLEPDNALILASLLEGVSEQTLSMSLAALLSPTVTKHLRVEASPEGPGVTRRIPIESFPPELQEVLPAEHRLATRINFVMPARVEIPGLSSEDLPYQGGTVNLSRGGACLRLQGAPDLRGRRVVLCLLPPQPMTDQQSATRRGAAEYCLRAEVAWIAPVPLPSSEPSGGSAGGRVRVGFRFSHLDEIEERAVEQLVAGFLNYPLRLEESGSPASLVSTFMECKNQKGYRIGISYDRPRKPLPPGSPLAIISPGFGETKRDYLVLAYALASNGFHVLRYDHTDHVGESAGDMARTTCTGMQQDLLALLRFAAHAWPTSPIVLVAAGMAGRVALRAVSPQIKVNLLILLGSILDIHATLQAVHGEDVISAYPKNARLGVINILGWNVAATCWLGDVIQGGYTSLRSTMKDAEKIKTPTILFAAEGDPWVSYSSVQEVQAALGSSVRYTHVLPEPFHNLDQDPRTSHALYRQLVADCLEHCYPAYPRDSIQDPPLREISRQKLLEQERTMARHGGARPVTVDLWGEAPGITGVTAESSDYWEFLDDIYRLMGRPQGDERILDAACGNGELGMALMINQAYRRLNAGTKDAGAPHYVGLDARGSVAIRTRENLLKLTVELRARFGAAVQEEALMHFSFLLSHLHRPLPLQDNSFDCVVCNLAIGGLPDPLSCAREFTRILVPNGKLVMTSFMPSADLTGLYRNLKAAGPPAKAGDQAQRLLRNWGRVLEQQRNGIFRFFEQGELLALLTSAGAIRPRIYATLANQAYIAVAEKPGA